MSTPKAIFDLAQKKRDQEGENESGKASRESGLRTRQFFGPGVEFFISESVPFEVTAKL
jgi:hypothetical protein